MKIDCKSIRGLSPPNKVNGDIEMNRRVPELVCNLSFENFGFLLTPTEYTSKKSGRVRVVALHLLDSLVPPDFLQVRVFGPCTNRELMVPSALISRFDISFTRRGQL